MAACASMRSCKAICVDSAVTDDCSGIAQRAEVAELASMYPADHYCRMTLRCILIWHTP